VKGGERSFAAICTNDHSAGQSKLSLQVHQCQLRGGRSKTVVFERLVNVGFEPSLLYFRNAANVFSRQSQNYSIAMGLLNELCGDVKQGPLPACQSERFELSHLNIFSDFTYDEH
jgi:hypothetical protein